MKTKTILTNFLPANLWNTPVFGKAKKEVASNIYQKEAQLEFSGGVATHLKTDLITSEVSKAFLLEVILLKYLPVFFLMWVSFNINLFYPSMVGLGLASVIYLSFYSIKKRVSIFFAYVFLLSLFLTYIAMFANNFNDFIAFNINNIANYVIQYFIALWLVERLFVDIYSLNFMNVYKIKNLKLSYFQINDEKSVFFKEEKTASAKKLFKWFLVFVIVFTSIVGGLSLLTKISASIEAQKQVLIQENNERKIIQSRNANALKALLDQQAQDIGLNKHSSKEQLELLEDDFEKYVKTQPIAYERLRLNLSTQLLNIKTLKTVNPSRAQVVKSWVQNYKGVYRWHYEPIKGQVFVVMNTKAR